MVDHLKRRRATVASSKVVTCRVSVEHVVHRLDTVARIGVCAVGEHEVYVAELRRGTQVSVEADVVNPCTLVNRTLERQTIICLIEARPKGTDVWLHRMRWQIQ
jgi:hypothetical protein